MGLFSWFGGSSKPDYETILGRLASDINDAKTHLSEIRLRERRWTLLVNAYGIAVWAVLFGLWWLNSLPRAVFGENAQSPQSRFIAGSVVASGPLVLYLLNKLVHFIFTQQRNSSERHLRKLLTEQRKHVEEIKKATNYDSTRKLIERYDDPLAAASSTARTPPNPKHPQSKQLGPVSAPGTPSTPGQAPDTPTPAGRQGTPRAPGHLQGAGGTPGRDPQTTPVRGPEGYHPDQAAALQLQLQSVQPVLPTPEKKWYDRVVDSILGDDPSQAATSQYALVCGECFRHNGLVPSKHEWERMQWICPRCNHMNMPPISRQSGERETPREPAPPSATAHLSRASPRQRRQPPAERGTPRSSRLGKEVFSAADASDDVAAGEEQDEDKVGDPMDVDEDK